MAIRDVVTRGYGNGTFDGTITLVTLRGYAIAEVIENTGTGFTRSGQVYGSITKSGQVSVSNTEAGQVR